MIRFFDLIFDILRIFFVDFCNSKLSFSALTYFGHYEWDLFG